MVSAWLKERTEQEVKPHEIGLFVRSEGQLDRAHAAVEQARLSSKVLDEHVATTVGQVSIGTMHLAKGLEFRAIVVMSSTTRSSPYRHASKRSLMTRISEKSTILSVTCYTSPVPAQGIICFDERGRSVRIPGGYCGKLPNSSETAIDAGPGAGGCGDCEGNINSLDEGG